MTETEWWTCTHPEAMLDFRRSRVHHRKLRLFAIWCWRYHFAAEAPVLEQNIVDVLERYLDGQASHGECVQAYSDAGGDRLDNRIPLLFMSDALAAAKRSAYFSYPSGTPFKVIVSDKVRKCEMIREMFGNPFCRPTLRTSWVSWNDRTVVRIAQGIDDDCDFDSMPILADALEDAGCDDAAILAHCRGPAPHAHGCWVVDLLLEKD